MKILDFLKENKVGAIVGGVYSLFSLFILYFSNGLNLNVFFIFFFLPVAFVMMPFLVFSFGWFNNIIANSIGFILSSIIVILIGAKIQSLIRKKSWKTLGFLFVIFLIIFGFLIFFGTYPVDRPLPNRCLFGTDFQCIDWQISATDSRLILRMKNNLGESITVSSIMLSTEATSPYICSTSPTNPTNLASRSTTDLTWTGCTGGGLVAGNRGKVLVTINYYTESNPTVIKEVKGEVFSTVR